MATDKLRLNNTILSWTSTSFLIGTGPYEGITSCSWSHSRKRKKVRAARKDGRSAGRTAGMYEPGEVKTVMLADTWDVLSTELAALGLGSYGDAEVPMLITSSEPGIPLPGANAVLMVSLFECCVTDVNDARQEGIDELLKEITWDTMLIVENGKFLSSLIRSVL